MYFWKYDQIELELMHRNKAYPPRFILEVHGESATYNQVALVEFEGVHQDLSAQIFLSLPTTGTTQILFLPEVCVIAMLVGSCHSTGF